MLNNNTRTQRLASVTLDDLTDGRKTLGSILRSSKSGDCSQSKECNSGVHFMEDCEMSQLLAFAQESDYKDFKDICIDGEIPSHQCSVQNCQLDHKNISCLLNCHEVEKVGYGAIAGTNSFKKSLSEANYKGILNCGTDTKTSIPNCDSSINNASGTRELGGEENSRNREQLVRRETMSSLEAGLSESSTFLSQSSTRFSAASRLAESDQAVSCSSGSMSSSKRSFAFPILEPEWDESPVRMAEADRRNLPKRQRYRWGACFLCYKF